MTEKIFVNCYLAHNLGDDLFLYTLLNRYPKVLFSLIADQSYGFLSNCFRNIDLNIVETFPLKNGISAWWKQQSLWKNKRDELIHDANAMVTIGGSLYMENANSDFRSLLRKERRYLRDKRTASHVAECNSYVIGANFGPYHTSRFLHFYRRLFLNYYQDVCFRDKYSADLFSAVPPVRYAPDVLFNTHLPQLDKKNKVFISVVDLANSNKFESLSSKAEDYDRLIAAYVRHYTELDYEIVLCSFCQFEGDENGVKKIVQSVSSEGIKVRVLFYRNNMGEILSELASSSIVIGTRFHAVVLGLLAGANVLPIMYSHKTKHVLEDIGFDIQKAINLKTDDWENISEVNLPEPVYHDVTDTVKASAKQFAALDEYLGYKG